MILIEIIITHACFIDILQDELRFGHRQKPYLDDLVAVVAGVNQTRAKFKDQIMLKDISSKVDILLDLATDRAILGRAWVGWQSWI